MLQHECSSPSCGLLPAAYDTQRHGVSFQLFTAGQAFPVLAGGLELIAPATPVITLKTLRTPWHCACSLKDKHLPRVTGRPFQRKDPWTLLDAKLMMMKLCLAVTSVIPLSNSKSLRSHRTEEVLKKDLSHFPNSHSKETAKTENEQKNLMMNEAAMPFFRLQNTGMYYSSGFY